MAITRQGYALMWLSGIEDTPDGNSTGPDTLAHTLVYRGPGDSAEVRTYLPGHLDPRAGDEADFPRFDSAQEAMTWMVDHPGIEDGKCLVRADQANVIRRDRYAQPV